MAMPDVTRVLLSFSSTRACLVGTASAPRVHGRVR